ncbi:MAG: hypothetical protein ACI9R3_003101 [Verrucomicrobiales bacterium]|jgi:hypothetical protein
MPESRWYEVFPENTSARPLLFKDHAIFIRNEVLKISSKETLYGVINELQLVKKWEDAKKPSDVYRMLSERIIE